MLDKLKTFLSRTDDERPRFRGWEDSPHCSVNLVGDSTLLFLGGQDNETNFFLVRRDLPVPHPILAGHIFDAINSVYHPLDITPTPLPPYYVTAAGMSDERKFHKATSMVGVSWIKKPHCTGKDPANWIQGLTLWSPGIYLNPMKRLRRTGSFDGLGWEYNRGPIPPDDHERIGRELLELFDLIRTDFDGGLLPKRT